MPPKPSKIQSKAIVYPQGVKEITDDLGMDELVRRLKTCAQSFQNMGQDDNNADYIPLALHLAQDIFLEHSNKDVRLLVACCIADVFRVYAPEAPYKDPEHLKNIFLFFIKQLRGLEDPKDAAFKRYFYLLENLAWVKSFNICIELEDNQEIFCQLFTLMFNIVNDDHSTKVKGFMLDMMSPLISEADSMTQELLDIILANIIEPKKSHNRNAYNLARDLLKKTASTIEPYIQAFFNNALILGKTSESDVATHLYELIYELNSISPSILLAVLPQLEFKLKSNDEKERLDVTRLLARMFSDKNSELAINHRALWNCFLGSKHRSGKQALFGIFLHACCSTVSRFNDISMGVRNRCVQYSMHFLLNHPELRSDITEQLKQRQHDPEENVRYEVVMAIISAAKRDFSSISDELLDFVKERTLDKKFKIRKEALIGLSMIFKRCMTNPEIPESTRECVSWIKNKVLHVYYQTALEDRLLVERILHTCLVPYQLAPEDRMKKLYQLYATVDEHAVKAFNELLKCQNIVRNHVRGLLELHSEDPNDELEKQISQKINILAKSLPEPVKAQEFLKKFNSLLLSDSRIRGYLETIVKQDCLCRDAEDNVRDLLKKLGNPVMTNVFYMTVKQLLERVAPVMIDKIAIQVLLSYVDDAQTGARGIIEDIGSPNAPERGLQLLHTLSYVFPGSFLFPEVYNMLLKFLRLQDETPAEITMQIFCNIGDQIESKHPEIAVKLIANVLTFTKEGTKKQAKCAIRCLDAITEKKEFHFGGIIEELKKNLSLECKHFKTALVSIGHIAYLYPDLFGAQMKTIVHKMIVKDLLMQDKEATENSEDNWCTEDQLSDETKAKIEGMKLMVRWLLGLKNNQGAGNSTLRLLTSVIENDGDLMKKGHISKPEMAWLRMTASCCLLKVVQEQVYLELLTTEQFQVVAAMLTDESHQVRERFAQKLHKGLIALKLPLDFLAIFALGSKERVPELKKQLKQYLLANINKRRDFIKQQTMSNKKLSLFLPDYVLPYAIHLLAHFPEYKKYDHVPTLNHLRECLWFLMEPLVIKNESYSFSFVKKLLENIKQTKDAQNPDDEVQNMKLYAVCDLALGLVMSKTANFVLKEFPVEPTALPSRLFTEIDRSFSNMKIYLPPDLASMFPKALSLDLDHHKAKTAAKDTGVTPKRGRGRPPAGSSSVARKSRATDSADSPHLEGDDSSDQPAAKRSREGHDGLEMSVVAYEEVVGATNQIELLNRENQEQQLVEEEEEGMVAVQHEETEISEQDSRHTTEDIIEDEMVDSIHTENDEDLIHESASSFTVTTESEAMTSSEQILTESEMEIGGSQESEAKDTEDSAAKEDDPFEHATDEEAEEEEEGNEEVAEPDENVKTTSKTKRSTASVQIRPESGTTKRLRSSGPVAEPVKTTRSTRSQSIDSKDSTSSISSATTLARTMQRQSPRKQVITTRRGISKEPKVSEAKETVRRPSELEQESTSSTTESLTSATSSASPIRRNLRRSNAISNGRGRTVNSDEDDSQESETSGARKITRASSRIAAKDAPSKTAPKKAPQRKGR